MKEKDLLQEEKMGGELYHLVVKKPSVGYSHGATLLEQVANLGEGMTLPHTIICAYNEEVGKIVCYEEKVAKEKEIGFVAEIKDNAGKKITKDDFIEILKKSETNGRIMSAEVSAKKLFVDMYIEEKQIIVSGGTVVCSAEMENEISRIINEGISDRETIEKNIKVMRDNRVGDGRILNILRRYKKFDRPAWIPDAFYCDVNPEQSKSILNRALKAALSGHALVFIGDKSVGKNVCAETVACVLGMPYYFMSFDAYMTRDSVFGETTTDNEASKNIEYDEALAYVQANVMPSSAKQETLEKAAKFEYDRAKSSSVQIVRQYSELVKWAQSGGVMMFNEYNMGDANLKQMFMNPMLDSTRALDVPGIGLLRLHPDCVLICSANPGFVGEMAANGATESRLGHIEFPNATDITKQLKAQLGENYVAEKYFKECNDYYRAIKAMVGTISDQCLNIRGFIRALQGVYRDIQDGEEVNLADDIKIQVINGCPEEDRPNLILQLNEIVN